MGDTKEHAKKEAFLAAYAECGTVRHAAEAAEMGRTRHYVWLKDEDYATAFEAAKSQAAESLVNEARRRASLGWEEPVFYKGKQVSTIRKYSDTLLIFLLKGALPGTYRERIEVSGDEDKPLRVTVGPRGKV